MKPTNHRYSSNFVVGKTRFGPVNFYAWNPPNAAYFVITEGTQAVFEVACEACGLYAQNEGRVTCCEKSIAKV